MSASLEDAWLQAGPFSFKDSLYISDYFSIVGASGARDFLPKP